MVIIHPADPHGTPKEQSDWSSEHGKQTTGQFELIVHHELHELEDDLTRGLIAASVLQLYSYTPFSNII